jgi:hypothetical protein
VAAIGVFFKGNSWFTWDIALREVIADAVVALGVAIGGNWGFVLVWFVTRATCPHARLIDFNSSLIWQGRCLL